MVSPTVLMITPQCTEHPLVYSWYPPTVLMITPGVLKSPSVLHTPRCTAQTLCRVDILEKFKHLIRKYPTAFWLPDTPLTVIPGHEHRILTGDAAPSYQLPYRKSPSELSAIKTELEHMLKLKIIKTSNSPWGSPCILVKKPAEHGKPQPPRFVVDYRRLNAMTQSDGYPYPPLVTF